MDFILLLTAAAQQVSATTPVITPSTKSVFDYIMPWLDTNWFGTVMSITSGITGGILVWIKKKNDEKKKEKKEKNKNEIDAFDSIINANEKFRKAIIEEKDKYKEDLENANGRILELEHKILEIERENLRFRDEIENYKVSIEELKNTMREFSKEIVKEGE